LRLLAASLAGVDLRVDLDELIAIADTVVDEALPCRTSAPNSPVAAAQASSRCWCDPTTWIVSWWTSVDVAPRAAVMGDEREQVVEPLTTSLCRGLSAAHQRARTVERHLPRQIEALPRPVGVPIPSQRRSDSGRRVPLLSHEDDVSTRTTTTTTTTYDQTTTRPRPDQTMTTTRP
jgi:hypothetical protein